MRWTRSVTRRPGRRRSGVVALVVAAAVIAGCGEELPERRMEVEPALELPDSLAPGQPVDIGYVWTPGAEFQPPADDYKVFLHVVDPDGNIIEQDDHYPPVPTSQWTSGEPVTYSRWLYPTSQAEVDYLDFYVGIYDDDGQVGVRWDGAWENRPEVRRVDIREDDSRGIPVYVEGFHENEVDAEHPSIRWTWMQRRGVVAFGNPRGPAILHLRGHSPVDETGGKPQTVRILVDGEELTTLEISDSTPWLERIEVPAEAVGSGDWVEVTLEVDSFFVPAHVDPASADTRELGLQIFGLYLAPR